MSQTENPTEVIETEPVETEVVEETETVEIDPVEETEVDLDGEQTEEEPPAEEPAVEPVVELDPVDGDLVVDEEPVAEETPVDDSFSITAEEVVAMRNELAELKAYKLEQENAQKDALINKYYMLDDEDKKDVIAHKEQYSLDEIESKLALIYVQKNVDFSTLDGTAEEVVEEEIEEDPISTFSLEEPAEIVSPLVASLRETAID